MEYYKKMYLRLFNAVTNAIVVLERSSETEALEILKNAQQDAEEIFISADEFKIAEEDSSECQ